MVTGYSISNYGAMVDCEPRMSAYAEALRQSVTPGCTVIDIGAGFGIFSLLACQYGAGSVIAIEPDDSVELLWTLAKANGFADRITIVRNLSSRYVPNAKADVVISDIRGTLPLFESHIATIVDARERLLAASGVLIPSRDNLKVALVHSPKAYRHCQRPWSKNAYGLDLSGGRQFSVNALSKVHLQPKSLASKTYELTSLDYQTINNPNINTSAELVTETDRIVHGMAIWFDAELLEGIGFSNAPGQPPLVYGQTFLPFLEPVRMKSGDSARVRIRADLVNGSYVWSWDSEIICRDAGRDVKRFRQSSFLTTVFTRERLEQSSNLFVPSSSSLHEIDRACLALIDGERSVGDIAEHLRDIFPCQFTNAQAALDHVTSLVRRYSNN